MENTSLAAKLAKLSPAQREELLKKIQTLKGNEQGALATRYTIGVYPRVGHLPLSFAQQRLWFLDQFEGQNPSYNMPAVFSLQGDLDVSALERAWGEIIRRHEILRTTFHTLDGVGQQCIAADMPLHLSCHDLSVESSSETLDDLCHAFFEHCFDLTTLPLFRLALIKQSAQQHLMLMNFHHIIFDGWSVGVLSRELEQLYNAYKQGQDSPLPPLPIQYADFSQWQRDFLNDARIEQELGFWRNYLQQAPMLNLPLDFPRPDELNHEGRTLRFEWPLTLSNELKKISKEQGGTLYNTLLGLFLLLCSRYSGQDDVVVGTPVANRNYRELEPLLGFFVNSLVIRANLATAKNFLDLQQQLQVTLREVWQHQSLPFEQLVNELNVRRQNNVTPIFQHMFVWQGEENNVNHFDGLDVVVQPTQFNTAKYDLTLTLSENSGQIRGEIEYRTACYTSETMQRFVAHFEKMAEQVAKNSALPLTEISLLTEASRKQLRAFNSAQQHPDWPASSMVARFEEQAVKFPQQVALRASNQTMTYQTLNEDANRLAYFLMEQGLKPGQWVAVSFERSGDLIVAIIAVLKCGAAYVPLDPASAPARNAMILDDAQPRLLLCDALRPFYGDRPVINTRELGETLTLYASGNPKVPITQHMPAYMIYTSGTTGTPKGVVISHLNVLRLFSQSTPPFEFSEHDCWTLFHSFAFDFSVWEIWGALFYGGTLVLVSRDETRDPEQFYQLLQREKVTVLNQTPSAFYQLVSVDQQRPSSTLALRYVIFGGEALNFTHLKPWVSRYGFDQPQLINMYGITETTVHVTWHKLCEADFLHPVSNIGRPLADLAIVLLDERGQQVLPGVVGEIHVAGRGLSEGYWQRPELNAERFITRTLYGKSERLYKSGDLAYYTPTGELIYVGRNDEQVKIRGYRIELGEINAQLKSCDGVKTSAVISDEDKKQLLAFVVFESSATQEPAQQLAQLRAHMDEHLPPYMRPAFFYICEQLPLTHNGKLDKRALLAQHEEARKSGASQPVGVAGRMAPRDHEEEVLAKVWREVLGLDWVGVFDNFFELGGDSILSLQIISRCKKAGVVITAKQLFEFQTIAGLAEAARHHSLQVIAQQDALSGDVDLMPIQQWFFDQVANQTIRAPHHWNQSLLFKLKQALTLAQLQRAWRLIIEKHDQLRCHFRSVDGQWSGFYKTLADMPECVSELACDTHDLAAAIQRYQSSLHIETGPLQQVVLIRCGEESYLFATIHHLLVDGVSWRIILDDLHTLLAQPEPGLEVLGQKTTSLREAREVMQGRLEGGEFDSQRAYWLSQLAANEILLPSFTPPDNTARPRKGRVEAVLDRALTQKLLHEASVSLNTEVNDLLITALLLSLKKWTGQTRLRLDLESHGRDIGSEQNDLSQTVGWFTAIFPQTFTLADNVSMATSILAVKEQVRAIPQQGLAYGWLASVGECPRLVDQAADILFNYLGQADRQSSPWLEWLAEPALEPVSADNQSLYPLEINAVIQGGELKISGQFDTQRLSAVDLEHCLVNYVDVLKHLILFCCETSRFAYSPSDFPLFTVPNENFESLIKHLSYQDTHRALEDVYPLTPMQQGMLFHALFDESGETYFEQIYIEIQGELNRAALEWAWQGVLARHPMLRTGFVWEDLPQPMQFVRSSVVNPLFDYSMAENETAAHALQRCLEAERQQGFALDQASLIRVGLLKKAEHSYYLLLNFHHLILDGWSMSLVLNELFVHYQQRCLAVDVQPTPGPRFEPFIRHLVSNDPAAAQAYWREQLGDFERATTLPGAETARLTHETPSVQATYATEVMHLPAELSQLLDAFTKRHHVTLNTLFQGAWAFLLSRYAGESTVVFGTTVAGRPAQLPQIEQTVGMFINTLPCVIEVPLTANSTQDVSILDWLEKIQQQYVAMQPFEHTSLSELQQLCRLGGGEHLFESILVFENYPVDQALSSEKLPFVIGDVNAVWKTNFPLTVIFIPGPCITLKMSYQGDLFSQPAVQGLMQQLTQILAYFVAHASQAVHQISLVSADERRRMLQQWNQNDAPYPAESSIAEQFDAIVQAQPHHPALWCEGELCSYQSLARQANQLAHHLISQGVGPETVVAFCGERSQSMLVSLLAILKAGGAYLPIDPNYPDERIRYMLDNAKAQWLIYQPEFKARLQELSLPLIDGSASYEHLPVSAPVCPIKPDQLALVIYTSGSTGKSKGIELTQRNVLRLVKNSNVIPLNSRETLLHYAPISFDAATYEIWGALLNGAKLVVAPRGHLDPELLGELIRQQGISTLFLTTALFHAVVDYHPEALAPLKVIMTGGEVVNAARVKALLETYPHLRFVNLYGPSENTTLTTYYSPENAQSIQGSVPIGYPVSNTQVYVLDTNLQPVPVGMAGELCTAGDGIARGYRFNAELTRQVFVPNPFAAEYGHGPVLYRSGDMARFRADGALEFLGRRDQQVKIRGHRIELGEVEAAIKQTANELGCGLREVIVRAQKSTRGSHLLAWCVLDDITAMPALKQAVAQRLPAYMLPAYWQTLDHVPLTPNGKVDHRALPEPVMERSVTQHAEPQNAVEKTLSEIWKSLLGLTQVGVHDNFFALGGDSILSIQLVSRAKRAGIRLSTRQVFENQSIAELAKVAGCEEQILAQQDALTERAALTPIQHWFFEQSFEAPHQWNMSLLLKPRQVAATEEALWRMIDNTRLVIRALVSQHDMLRAIYPQGKQQYLPLDWTHPRLQQMFQVVVIDDTHPEALEAALSQAQASLDLAQGPLFRALWYRWGNEQRLLLVVHHLVMDGVSWRILLEDLALAFDQVSAGKSIHLGPKTTAFAHWSQRLWQYADAPAVQAQNAYWQGIHTARSNTLVPDLIAQPTRADNRAEDTCSAQILLDVASTELLLRQAPKAYHTEIGDLLLSALVATLDEINREQGQPSAAQLIALEGHGREYLGEQYDTSRTVGWFTTLYPVLLEARGHSWDQKIKAIKQGLREIPRNGLSYGLLRYQASHDVELGGRNRERGDFASNYVQPQISFNYLGQTSDLFNETQSFVLATESPGSERAATAHQPYLIDIGGLIQSGEHGPQLQLMWRYSDKIFSQKIIQRWLLSYQQHLLDLIAYCSNPQHGGRVPADFPLLQLSQTDIDQLMPRPRDIETLYPLSPLQQGLWFHHKLLAGGEGLYFEQHIVILQGQMNWAFLQEAWQHVANRHSIFRSDFVEVTDTPVQRVHRRVQVPLQHYHERDIDLESLLARDRQQSFDFEQAPLMRVAVLSSADECQHQMVWSFHHILLDGWSVALVLGELLHCYQHLLLSDAVPALPPAPLYQDYIQWISEQDANAARQFWREAMAGFAAPTPLPLMTSNIEAEPVSNKHKPMLGVTLSTDLTTRLNQFAQGQQVTLNTLFQAAWAYLLAAYSGDNDVVFGITVSGRPPELSDIEQRVGLFINTLPMRVTIDRAQGLGDWLQGLQAQQNEARSYEYLPLFTIQSLSEVRGELFQTLLVFENYPVAKELSEFADLPGAVNILGSRSVEQTHYPLTLVVLPDETLGLQLSYAPEVFSEQQIQRLLKQMTGILEQMLDHTDKTTQPVGALTLLLSEDLVRIHGWNQTYLTLPENEHWVSLFAQQVALRPEALALAEEGQKFTYQQLDQVTNQLAAYLLEQGLQREGIVAVMLERGIEATVAMLAVLKAGGVYVPVDPYYPPERIRFMLSDTRAAFLLSRQVHSEKIQLPSGLRLVLTDTMFPTLSAYPGERLGIDISPRQLAYIVYTSGSTGQPKGVQIEHRSLLNFCLWAKKYLELGPSHRHSVMAGFGFDASVLELWPSLIAGASLHFVPEAVKLAPELLMDWLVNHAISHAFMPTVIADYFIKQAPVKALQLQCLVIGGDRLVHRPAYALPYTVFNAYGPSESTVISTMARLDWTEKSPPPIGYPIANTQVYLLDSQKREVSVGIAGELYVGGLGLARAYLNRPDLTAEKFIKNPYSSPVAPYLYATGDLARYREDGQLEFLGRIDHQVKIRGVRIELGEIEAQLAQIPGIEQAVVVVLALEGETGVSAMPTLVAYLQTTVDINVPDLRATLAKHLPDIMIPKVFQRVERFALTANGKVNRKTLPSVVLPKQLDTYVAPRNDIELKLAQIWQQILQLERVSIHDDFFALGGHSLLATRVNNRLRDAFMLEIPLRTLFEVTTIAQLAGVIQSVLMDKGRNENDDKASTDDDFEEGAL